MPEKELQKIAENAKIIVNGYASMHCRSYACSCQ